jgi:anti-sigma B factor antagonist
MPQADVKMNVRKVKSQASIIDIQGEITAFAENALMDAYTQASAGETQVIILNFSQVEYMNSGGIGLLVVLLVRIRRQGQRLLAFGVDEHYQNIFELTRLNEVIGIYATETEAVATV